jgi:hypothetical protein
MAKAHDVDATLLRRLGIWIIDFIFGNLGTLPVLLAAALVLLGILYLLAKLLLR